MNYEIFIHKENIGVEKSNYFLANRCARKPFCFSIVSTVKPASSKLGVVKTTAIKGVPGKITIKKGSRKIIKAKIVPSKSTEKITYTSANKKIVTITGKGMIKAKNVEKQKLL